MTILRTTWSLFPNHTDISRWVDAFKVCPFLIIRVCCPFWPFAFHSCRVLSLPLFCTFLSCLYFHVLSFSLSLFCFLSCILALSVLLSINIICVDRVGPLFRHVSAHCIHTCGFPSGSLQTGMDSILTVNKHTTTK